MPRFSLFFKFTFFLICTGCSVGPKYKGPSVDAPPNWKNSQEEVANAPTYKDYWWEVFEDEKLDALERQAIENNYDLYIAYTRVKQARAQMNYKEADFYPQLTLQPKYSNEGVVYESYSDHVIVRAHELLYFLPFKLSYELDLWGRIQSQYESARYNWQGRIQAFNAILLNLTTDLAITYYQIRTLDSQINLLKSTLKALEKAFQIAQSRYKFQITNYSDVARAGLEVSTTLATYREVLRQRDFFENQLAVLLGMPPEEFCLEQNALQDLPPKIPAGVPTDVLARRPDIAEAERLMASEHALINSAYASFLPSFTLTAAGGSSSPHLRYFLTHFGRYWALGADALQIIFDGGRLCANLAIQIDRFKEASAAYQQQVLVSFQDVENALSNLDVYEKEFEDITAAVEWSKKTYNVASSRYTTGVTFYLDVITSERDQLSNEILLNNLRGLRFASTIQLIKALGGGWNSTSDKPCLTEGL